MKELGECSESDAYDIRSAYWPNATLCGVPLRTHEMHLVSNRPVRPSKSQALPSRLLCLVQQLLQLLV